MTETACDKAKKARDEMTKMYLQILNDYKEDKLFIVKFKRSQEVWVEYQTALIDALYPRQTKEFQVRLGQCVIAWQKKAIY